MFYHSIKLYIIIVLVMVAWPLQALAQSEPVIRVLLAEGQQAITVSGQMEIHGLYSSPHPISGVKTFQNLELKSAVKIFAQSGYISVNGNPYRGEIVILPGPAGLMVINHVELEEYLFGVVPGEISPYWPTEALKAQAVAARCFALTQMQTRKHQDFDVYNDTRSQTYSGVSKEHKRTNDAVNATSGEVAVYKGKVIEAYFSGAAGGITASSVDVWGEDLPYLQSVPDFDQNSPYYEWSLTMTVSDLLSKLKTAGYDIGMLVDIVPVEKDPSGRILKIRLIGESGEVEMVGTKFRFMVNLRSTKFELTLHYPAEENPDSLEGMIKALLAQENHTPGDFLIDEPAYLEIKGYGWGHGVGMSQWGAREMALNGKNYKEILTYYYQGIDLVQMYK